MKKALMNIYKAIRLVVVTLLSAAIILFAALYVILSVPSVHDAICKVGEEELSKILGTKVEIGGVTVLPFHDLVLNDVSVPDQNGDSLLYVKELGAGISIYNLVMNQRLVFTYGEVVGMKGFVKRESKQSPLNVQFIIDALSSKDKTKPPTKFDIKIYNLVIRKSELSYDVLDQPRKADGFDANHIHITNLRADVALPRIKNNDFVVDVKRISFEECCGINLKNLATMVKLNDKELALLNTRIELPNSVVKSDSIGVSLNGIANLAADIKQNVIELRLDDDIRITPSDLAGFVPALSALDDPFNVSVNAKGNIDGIDIKHISVKNDDGTLSVNLEGEVTNLADVNNMSFDVSRLNVSANVDEALNMASVMARIDAKTKEMLNRLGKVDIKGKARGSLKNIDFDGDVLTSLGNFDINAQIDGIKNKTKLILGKVQTDNFKLGTLLNQEQTVGSLAANVELDAELKGKSLAGRVFGVLPFFELKGYKYQNAEADVIIDNQLIDGFLAIADPNCDVEVEGHLKRAGRDSQVDLNLAVANINLAALNLYANNADKDLSFDANVSLHGDKIDNINGDVLIKELAFVNESNEGLKLDALHLNAQNDTIPQSITLSSDFVNGSIQGSYDFVSLVPTMQNILSQALPSLIKSSTKEILKERVNDFRFNFVVEPCEDLQTLVKMPVNIVYNTTLTGFVNETDNSFCVDLTAPYLQQGNKIIESTYVQAMKMPEQENVKLVAKTTYPMKTGKTIFAINGNGVRDRVDADLSWKILTDRDYKGNINLSSLFDRDAEDKLAMYVDVNPTEMVFNDTIWQVKPSKVKYEGGTISIDNMRGVCDNQLVLIDGVVSKNAEDVLKVELNEVSLDFVFDALAIDNVMFGGTATGKFYAKSLLSGAPILETPNLHVENIAYNKCRMGNADIRSNWDNDTKGINILADIKQDNGLTSIIDGTIYPTLDSLSINFDARKAKIGFLQHFMAAITSDIKGEVSGKACLYGDFHNINLYGDVFADELTFKVDYTNVYYTASDSVHIVPGFIEFEDIEIRDREGNTAKVNGWLKHDYFHNPEFDFNITEAKEFLCYDVTSATSPDWYGTIYGNGSAYIKGGPGICEIGVNMETRDRSKFTFVLSDNEAAAEYSFITFVDRNKKDEPEDDGIPQIVKELTAKNAKKNESKPSVFKLDLQGDITNLAQLTVVMDPVGGDKIRGNGSGNLRLTYDSTDESLGMYGKYVLEKGSYNFTLQDIIIKDFTINSGGSISFNGDPYAANLDIKAIYSLNANLLDLDESFASDRELNRTNVPVNAILMARGDMRQPDISFDLEFPTISTEAERKVKSIVSTDDMMNKQMLYLLALNRFYTPEYMGNTNRNNELASVASSTLSSQLSNMLGQLSDKWSISPNFRSDKGDFSDVEVDLALSSQLLNNRLIFNGNFGYRDNSMNTRNSNFIGDFDIEYLLNRTGTLRLKAYNHFNDQNYLVRSAMTTQGVGVEFKLDFENPFVKKRLVETLLQNDSVATDSNKKEAVE